LLTLGFMTAEEGARSGWDHLFEALQAARRATVLGPRGEAPRLWIAAEKLPQMRALHPAAPLEPEIAAPPRLAREWSAGEALVEIVRGRLEGVGPVTAGSLAADLGLRRSAVETALASL